MQEYSSWSWDFGLTYRSSFITYAVLGLAHTYASTVEKLLVFEAFPSSVHDNQSFPTIKHEAFESYLQMKCEEHQCFTGEVTRKMYRHRKIFQKDQQL